MAFRFLFIILTIVPASIIAAAQPPKLVTARAAVVPAQLKPGAKAVLTITLEMADDTHVNSNAPRDPNLIPTVFTTQSTAGIVWGKPQYPVPTEVTEWYADDPLPVYQNGDVIEVPFTIETTATGKIIIGGSLLTQACDHEQCYLPRKLPISITLQLADATATPKDKPTNAPNSDFSFNSDAELERLLEQLLNP